MVNILKLIRVGNLLMALFLQLLLQTMLINPLMNLNGFSSTPLWIVCCYMAATFLIGAGANIINNLVDIETDLINRENSVIVGKSISPQTCHMLYIVSTLSGIIAGSIPVLVNKDYGLILILGTLAGVMWFYSYTFKKIALLGNFVVASVVAFIFILPVLYDLRTLEVGPLLQIVGSYAVFAFLLTMARELIKCMEDIKGDKAMGIKTLPVAAGMTVSKIAAIVFIAIIITFLGYFQYLQIKQEDFFEGNYISTLYLFLMIQVPLLYVCVTLLKAQTQQQFHTLSVITKMTMLAGILTIALFYYLMNK